MSSEEGKVDVLMIGTGEYTTGYVGGTAADSDKGAGVVALTMFDFRRRGKVDRLGMCGVNVRSDASTIRFSCIIVIDSMWIWLNGIPRQVAVDDMLPDDICMQFTL